MHVWDDEICQDDYDDERRVPVSQRAVFFLRVSFGRRHRSALTAGEVASATGLGRASVSKSGEVTEPARGYAWRWSHERATAPP